MAPLCAHHHPHAHIHMSVLPVSPPLLIHHLLLLLSPSHPPPRNTHTHTHAHTHARARTHTHTHTHQVPGPPGRHAKLWVRMGIATALRFVFRWCQRQTIPGARLMSTYLMAVRTITATSTAHMMTSTNAARCNHSSGHARTRAHNGIQVLFSGHLANYQSRGTFAASEQMSIYGDGVYRDYLDGHGGGPSVDAE